METALLGAGVDPSDVDLVVASAASLPDLDAAESRAIRAIFEPHAPLVTAPAGALGRTFVASGALNVAAGIVALEAHAVPPTATTANPSEEAPDRLVLGTTPITAALRNVVANAWSLGGQCASLVLREVPV